MRYRPRYDRVDAIRFDGGNVTDVADFLGLPCDEDSEPADAVILELPAGDEELGIGDYLARDDAGDLQPCPGPIFEWFFVAVP